MLKAFTTYAKLSIVLHSKGYEKTITLNTEDVTNLWNAACHAVEAMESADLDRIKHGASWLRDTLKQSK